MDDGWMNGWMDRRSFNHHPNMSSLLLSSSSLPFVAAVAVAASVVVVGRIIIVVIVSGPHHHARMCACKCICLHSHTSMCACNVTCACILVRVHAYSSVNLRKHTYSVCMHTLCHSECVHAYYTLFECMHTMCSLVQLFVRMHTLWCMNVPVHSAHTNPQYVHARVSLTVMMMKTTMSTIC